MFSDGLSREMGMGNITEFAKQERETQQKLE